MRALVPMAVPMTEFASSICLNDSDSSVNANCYTYSYYVIGIEAAQKHL